MEAPKVASHSWWLQKTVAIIDFDMIICNKINNIKFIKLKGF